MLRRNFLGAIGGLLLACGVRTTEVSKEPEKPTNKQKVFRGHPYKVASDVVISKGDLLWYDDSTGCVRPASQFPWHTDVAKSQAEFARKFVGVANSAGDSYIVDGVVEVML